MRRPESPSLVVHPLFVLVSFALVSALPCGLRERGPCPLTHRTNERQVSSSGLLNRHFYSPGHLTSMQSKDTQLIQGMGQTLQFENHFSVHSHFAAHDK